MIYWTVDLAELQSLYSVKNNDAFLKLAVYSIVYNSVKHKYEAIYTQNQFKIFRHLKKVQMNASCVIVGEL